MIRENSERDALYSFYSGELEDLAGEVTELCTGDFDGCEFFEVSIERSRDGGTWKVHEFPSFEERTARAIRNHLKAGDVVRLDFEADERMEFIICRTEDTEAVSRFIGREELEDHSGELVVVGTGGPERVRRDFLERLGK
ncbi:MAG: hypothetical protein ABEK01_00690 [Candidatus Nanohaloarchaea archaeon]